MKSRIYTDTSVLGGCEDEEFAEYSVRLTKGFVKGDLVLVLSSLTVQELASQEIDDPFLRRLRRHTSRPGCAGRLDKETTCPH